MIVFKKISAHLIVKTILLAAVLLYKKYLYYFGSVISLHNFPKLNKLNIIIHILEIVVKKC